MNFLKSYVIMFIKCKELFMKNYIEHELKVKYCDCLFEHSNNWQWFVDAIEQDFSFDEINIDSWNDYNQNYQKIKDVYECFVNIHQCGNIKLKFNKSWLKKLNLISMLYNNKTTINLIWNKLEDSFFKLFALNVYITVLLNKTNDKKYIYSTFIFTQNNIFELFDISEVVESKTDILNYLKDINLRGIITNKKIFQYNIQRKTIPYRKSLFKKYTKFILSSNSFDFRAISINQSISWQEQYFYDMLNIKIQDKKLVPVYNINGHCYPDFSCWTHEILNNMKVYFNNNNANYIIESIDYMLHNTIPSEQTIQTHFNFETKHLRKLKRNDSFYKINDSSFLIISYLMKDKLLSNHLKSVVMKDFAMIIKKFIDPFVLLKFKEYNIPITNVQNTKIKNYNKQQASLVNNIKNFNDFINYCNNIFVPKAINDSQIIKLHEIFLALIKVNNGVLLAAMFYHYLMLIMRSKQSSNIKKVNLEQIMIDLKEMWKNSYYDKTVNSLHEVEFSQKISNEYIEQHNNICVNTPIIIAKNCFPTDHETIFNMLSEISKNVISLFCTKYSIFQNFPTIEKYTNTSEIDKCFLEYLDDLIKNKGYRLLNKLDIKVYAPEIFRQYNSYTIFNFSLFNKWQLMYNNIKSSLPNYKLLEIKDDQIFLGHITQLFPIIENQVRKLGTYFGIAPFKENETDFLQAKDPSSILIKLILQYYNDTHDFVGVSDLFFVYYVLYNNNSFNIRNECVHGNSYQSGDNLLFAFKVTIVCLKLILNRIEAIERHLIV